MTGSDPKADLRRYLQAGREALLWKLDGLSEYDIRRPMVPTGTNLLGIVKHVASVEAGYFGETFGRLFEEPLPWLDDDAEPNADMWATAEESREQIVGLYRRVWAHSDATIDTLPLDAVGQVPWWPPDRREVTLHRPDRQPIHLFNPDRPLGVCQPGQQAAPRPAAANGLGAQRRPVDHRQTDDAVAGGAAIAKCRYRRRDSDPLH
jgi:Protein of unknown function (DUF664)